MKTQQQLSGGGWLRLPHCNSYKGRQPLPPRLPCHPSSSPSCSTAATASRVTDSALMYFSASCSSINGRASLTCAHANPASNFSLPADQHAQHAHHAQQRSCLQINQHPGVFSLPLIPPHQPTHLHLALLAAATPGLQELVHPEDNLLQGALSAKGRHHAGWGGRHLHINHTLIKLALPAGTRCRPGRLARWKVQLRCASSSKTQQSAWLPCPSRPHFGPATGLEQPPARPRAHL